MFPSLDDSSTLFFPLCIFFALAVPLVWCCRVLLRLRTPSCGCDTCKSYVSGSWSAEFPNLSDWYVHLLCNSPTRTVHVHVLRNVITADPANVEHIIAWNFGNYPKGKAFSDILGDLLGRGIFNVDGVHWKLQRKLASSELGSICVREHAFGIVSAEITDRLVPLLLSSRGEVMDLQEVFRRFSFDTVCKFSFGLDPGCLDLSMPLSSFAQAFDLASRLSAERALAVSPVLWKIMRLFNVGSERKLRQATRLINVLAEQVIKQRRLEMNKNINKNSSDLLSRFIRNIKDDGYLRDIVISFLLAGRDTVASGLTGFFWLLSKNPRVEKCIREESDAVMGTMETGEPSFNQIRDMQYLHAAVHESLRLLPPVQFDSKFSLRNDVLPDGTFISGQTRVTYHPYAMGRMEQIWGPDATEFRPERWLRDSVNGPVFSPESPFKYPVFQGGPRVCLGKEVAVMEMKSVALALIRRFDVRLVDRNQPLRFSPGLTANVSGGLPVIAMEKGNGKCL
ncbi:hypothetical protein MLD38_011694 [Melastoma candidum]|uniref:Uncharacterized protein n=1 Tax=Melastoma candidum TaxID=119954 RepID=A0ACB9R4G2_9MYRT|nr:hypothetical protein MLD38_011694 [Melastoma candidum]